MLCSVPPSGTFPVVQGKVVGPVVGRGRIHEFELNCQNLETFK